MPRGSRSTMSSIRLNRLRNCGCALKPRLVVPATPPGWLPAMRGFRPISTGSRSTPHLKPSFSTLGTGDNVTRRVIHELSLSAGWHGGRITHVFRTQHNRTRTKDGVLDFRTGTAGTPDLGGDTEELLLLGG